MWQAVIGLEVHAQLLTESKLFCGCPTAYGALPNTHVCPTCLGLPGALPVLNAQAVKMAVKAAIALDCTIHRRSRFARKNYFYPDSPKGYQISQFDEPFSTQGHLDVDLGDGSIKRAGITRIHMEEDAGKNMHDFASGSVVDLNRAGVPLIEIVGDPDLSSAREAAAYLRALREVLLFLGVNDGNLEEGSFRCDANVSIRKPDEPLGTRVELKNINSFRFVERAIASEIERQKDVLETGGRLTQETRGWDEKSGTTFSLRSKEEAQDYRYFPEPDLPPLVLEDVFVERLRHEVPETPRAKRARFLTEWKLTAQTVDVLTQHPRVAAFFEEAARLHGDGSKVANFVQGELLRDVVTRGSTATFPLTPAQLEGLLNLVDAGKISGKQAKEVYARLKGTDADPKTVVSDLGMAQVTNPAFIQKVCRQVMSANPKQVEQVRSGRQGIFGFLVGQVMKATNGSANPQLVNDILKRLLDS